MLAQQRRGSPGEYLGRAISWVLAALAFAGPWAGSEAHAHPFARATAALAPPSDIERPLHQRSVELEAVRIVGREQVALRQIQRVLAREGLIRGADILVPDDPRVRRATARLRGTGYFKRVTLRIDAVPEARDRAVLVVDVEERSSVVVTDVHLGSSRLTPFRGGLGVMERNFLGRDVHLGGSFIWGSLPRIPRAGRQQAYRVYAEAPRIGASKIGALGSVYVVSASEPYRVEGEPNDPDPDLFRALDYTRFGGVAGLSFAVLPTLNLGVDYRFERVDALLPDDPVYLGADGTTEPIDLLMRSGIHRHTSAHFGIAWDGREEVILTGKGGRIALDLQVSSPGIGSQYEYIKIVSGGAYTFRLPWRHWITPSLTAGQIAGNAPRFERFYAGDLHDWTPGREQALIYSTRNPIDVFGTGIDSRPFGILFARVDLEYVWPLFRRIRTRGVYAGDLFISSGVFTIVGTRGERDEQEVAGENRVPIGFNANLGVRLDTAIGTFDLSVGNVLRRTPL